MKTPGVLAMILVAASTFAVGLLIRLPLQLKPAPAGGDADRLGPSNRITSARTTRTKPPPALRPDALAAEAALSGDFQAAVQHALSDPSRGHRYEALGKLAKSLSGAELPGALKVAQSLKDSEAKVILSRAVMERWGELDPEEALKAAQAVPNVQLRSQAINAVVTSWAAKDPD